MIAQGNDAGSTLDVRKPVPQWLAWTESLVITAISIGLPALAHANNPFYIDEGFPWPVLGPMLCGLRYGFSHGLTSALLLLALLGGGFEQGWWPAGHFPSRYAVGMMALAMLSGEFRDIWERRLQRLQAANAYRSERLESFTRSFHLLRLSHDQLEQQLAGSGLSLREALTRLRALLPVGGPFNQESAAAILSLLSEYGSLYCAAIFAVDERGQIDTQARASIGEFPALTAADSMLRRCLREGQTYAVNADVDSLDASRNSPLLMAVPLIDSNGVVHAILAVHSLPFFALTAARIKVLSVLAAHAADQFWRATDPMQQLDFKRELARALNDQEQFGLPATVIIVQANSAEALAVLQHWKKQLRALDVWREQSSGAHTKVAILLPLSDESATGVFLSRLDKHEQLQWTVQAISSASAAQTLLAQWEH